MKMKKVILFFAMILIATQAFSATGYGYKNNRIAVSADGNNQPDPDTWGGTVTATAPAVDAGKTFTYNSAWQRGDEDDWSATPAALAMLAHAGLEGNLVHYSYNNFIGSPAHTTSRNVMKEGVDGALEHWTNFDASVFYDVSADNAAAINHLAEQIKISTAEDPLYFVSMGPSEFLYQALEKVKADGKESAINHLYILSHSNYNDNHIRRENHRRVEHILTDFPVQEGVNFKRIKDQNQSSNLNNGWSSSKAKSGGKTWYPYNFLRDHWDLGCLFLWDMLNADPNLSKPDISDAGMVWFLLYGDQDGNPNKLRTKFMHGVKPENAPEPDGACPAVDVYETDGLLVFEAERIPLRGNWKLGTDEEYASGGKYIYYDGPNNYQNQNPADILSYSFKINTPGTYAFKWFVRQNEEERGKVEGQQGTDLSNDAWVRFSDGIGYWGATQTTDFIKFYGRSDPGFWLHGVGEKDHKHNWVYVKVSQAGTYTMEICGRSHGYQIDKIVMAKDIQNWGSYTEKTEYQARHYWSETGTPDPDCVRPVKGCETILAKDFTNLSVDGYDPATIEWRKSVTWDGGAKELIKCDGTYGTTRPIAAEVVYNGTPQGNAIFKVHAMQEPDGECVYGVYINGVKVGEEQISSSYETTHEIEDEGLRNAIEEVVISTQAVIKTGDVIRVTSNQVTNGKVPEGNTTATARGRWYALELCVGGEPAPDKYTISTSKVKEVINTTEADNKNVTVGITYTASKVCDLVYSIKSVDGSEEFAFGRVNGLAAGRHSIDVPLNLKKELVLETAYKIHRWFMPEGGTFENQYEPAPIALDWTYSNVPEEDKVEFIDPPVEVSDKLLQIPVKVKYWATQERWVNVELKTAENEYITNSWVTVPVGEGDTVINLTLLEPLTKGSGYKYILSIRPVDGTWQDNIYKVSTDFTAVEGNEEPPATIEIAEETANVDVGATVKLNATTTPVGEVITWSSSDDLIATVDSDGNVTGIKAGNVTIKALVSGGNFDECSVTVNPSSITSLYFKKELEIKVYPNPFSDQINFTNNGKIKTVEIYDISGQILLSQAVVDGLNSISLENYDSGVYLMKFKFINNTQEQIKITK